MVGKNNLSAEGCGPSALSPRPVESLQDGIAFLPMQSLPKPFSDLYVNPNAITYTPSQQTPCIPSSVTNLTGLLSWIEQNIIAPYCDLRSGPGCKIQISKDDGTGTIKVVAEDIREALVRCLGLTDLKPHIVYDSTTGTLKADLLSGTKPNCSAFVELFQKCPAEAPAGQEPDYIIGYFLNKAVTPNVLIPQTYRSYFKKPTKLFAQMPFGNSDNNYVSVSSNQRLFIKNTITNRHVNQGDGGQFEPATTKYTIATEGWYRVAISVMVNIKYQALAGWIIAPMVGIRHDKFSVNLSVPPIVEYRIDERVMYLDGGTEQDITLTGSSLIYCGNNDTLVPRVWFSNTFVPRGESRTVAMWINRSADTIYSISRVPEYDTRIIGN